MTKQILKYTTFTSSESFERWQANNPALKIKQIDPLPQPGDPGHASLGGKKHRQDVHIFVVYF